jgi:hypothetical protein
VDKTAWVVRAQQGKAITAVTLQRLSQAPVAVVAVQAQSAQMALAQQQAATAVMALPTQYQAPQSPTPVAAVDHVIKMVELTERAAQVAVAVLVQQQPQTVTGKTEPTV